MVANAAEFMRLAAARTGTVEVRGGTVHIKEMTVADRRKFLDSVKDDPTAGPTALVQMCAITPDGKPLFSADEAASLASAAPEVVDAVAAAVLRLSGLEGDEKNA